MRSSSLTLGALLACALTSIQGETPPAKTESARMLRVVVLDPQGKPLPEANVHAGIWTDEKDFKANRDYKTDKTGTAQVELPKTFTIVRLWASKKPFIGMFTNWEQGELVSTKQFPTEYTLRLETGVTAGGKIVDEGGKPIAGAKVQVRLNSNPKPVHTDGRARYDTSLAHGSAAATTDADGRWRIANVPNHTQVELGLLVTHPDYIADERWQESQKTARVTTAMLRNETATLTLKRGVIVRGRVTDPSGKPIKDAIVIKGDRPYGALTPCDFLTDADGQFSLPALAPKQTTLTVIAPGFAPQLRKLDLQADLATQEFRMVPGKPIKLRIVDASGKPVAASVYVAGWKGSESLHNYRHPSVRDTRIPGGANAGGIWQWTWAPDEPVKLRIGLKGYAGSELEIAGGAPERTVVLKAEHRITGVVSDAATGKPIPAFTVVPIDVFRKDWLSAERGNAIVGKDGRLSFMANRTDIPLRLRVEALGYRTQDGPEFRVGDDAGRTQDFRLEPSPPITGAVHDAGGKAVAKAEVLLATPTQTARLSEDWGNHKSSSDSAGRFIIPDPGEPFIVLARADAGFAMVEFPAGKHDVGTLQLRPWATIRGQFRDGGKPVAGALILLELIRIGGLDRPSIGGTIQTRTDADGRFEFLRVPAVPVRLSAFLGPWTDPGYRSGPSLPLNLEPAQQAELVLGGNGAIVTGKVKLTGKVPADLDCTFSINRLICRARAITPPPEIAKLGFDIRNGWRESWTKSSDGLAYLQTLQHWFVKLAPDGTFRISGVPPGEYDLALAVYSKPDG